MGDDEGIPAAGVGGDPGEGGALAWALDVNIGSVDPLLAETPAERLVARQVYEPLVARVAAPFDEARRVNGPALRVRSRGDRTIWKVVLRQGVRFQDGAPLNASAVLANVERWQASPIGRRLLPRLFEADAPRPHLVRFLLSGPDRRLDERLASPRLGLVSPRALGDDPAELATQPLTDEDAGAGPFDLREQDRAGLLLAPNTGWWGSERGLGPVLDRVELVAVPSVDERLRRLLEGEVQVADGIDRRGLRQLRGDPLVAALSQGDGRWRGIERSVRGIDTGGGTPSLQRVWLTTLDGG